jgi:hypothetical protein
MIDVGNDAKVTNASRRELGHVDASSVHPKGLPQSVTKENDGHCSASSSTVSATAAGAGTPEPSTLSDEEKHRRNSL